MAHNITWTMARNLVEANDMDIPEVLLLDAVDKDSVSALGFMGPANCTLTPC